MVLYKTKCAAPKELRKKRHGSFAATQNFHYISAYENRASVLRRKALARDVIKLSFV